VTDTAIDNRLEDFAVGDTAQIVWHVTEEEIKAFAALSGDRNPLHMDSNYARSSGFENQIAHGLLIGAKISGVIGMQLPGKRCLLLEQKLSYPNPLYPGDSATVKVEVQTIHTELAVIELKVTVEKLSVAGAQGSKVARGKVTCKILS
jgi:3-hydroxybutyryl-CoA dehydratase